MSLIKRLFMRESRPLQLYHVQREMAAARPVTRNMGDQAPAVPEKAILSAHDRRIIDRAVQAAVLNLDAILTVLDTASTGLGTNAKTDAHDLLRRLHIEISAVRYGVPLRCARAGFRYPATMPEEALALVYPVTSSPAEGPEKLRRINQMREEMGYPPLAPRIDPQA